MNCLSRSPVCLGFAWFKTRTSDARNENAISPFQSCAITRKANAHPATPAGGNAIAQSFQPNAGNANAW